MSFSFKIKLIKIKKIKSKSDKEFLELIFYFLKLQTKYAICSYQSGLTTYLSKKSSITKSIQPTN